MMTTQQALRRRRRKVIIFATFVTSVLSSVLIIVSIATDSWVTGSAAGDASVALGYSIEANYGLFVGSMTSGPLRDNNDLTVVCDSGEAVCMMGCESVGEAMRKEVLKALINCPNVTLDAGPCVVSLTAGSLDCVDENVFGLTASADQQGTDQSRRGLEKASDVGGRDFIDYGMRMTVIVFCGFALFFSLVCCGLALLNTVRDPSTTILSTFGLGFVFNPCAGILSLLILILWGAHHSSVLSNNLMVPWTLAGAYPNNDVSLGYSYWLLLPPMMLHGANVVLVYLCDRPEKLAVRQTSVEDRKEAVNTMIY